MPFREMIMAVDKESQRVIWHTPYREWPRMMPSTAQLAVFAWRGSVDVKDQDFDDLNVRHDRRGIELSSFDGDESEKERLLFAREKCILCWRWLIQLHDLRLSTMGLLPGIPLGKKNTNDRELFEQEQSRMIEVIADEINRYHDRIWLAADPKELELLAQEMAGPRHHNRQPYY